MTHSLEELSRQLTAAIGRFKTAEDQVRTAKKALYDAQCERSGLIGKTLITKKYPQGFVVDRIKFDRNNVATEIHGHKIKKDGTVGRVAASIWGWKPLLEGVDYHVVT